MAARLSAKRSIRILAYPSALTAAAVALTLLRTSGSSVGIYSLAGAYVVPAPSSSAILIGTPRYSRWDEWHVTTPYIVSQSKIGFPRFSPSGMGGQDLAVILDVPNRHWSTFFKPFNWPFFLLDVESAFAARWWLIALLLLIPSYALFFVLTGRITLAAAFSTSLFLSPFIHWWYLSFTLVVPGMAMAALASLIAASRTRGIRRWLLLILSAYCTVGFALLIYPPFQVSTGLVIGALGVGWMLRAVLAEGSARDRLRPVVNTGLVTIVAGIVIARYYVDVSSTIASIANTVYPGERRIMLGGGASLRQVLGAPFDYILSTTNDPRVNQPEASSFLLTGLFVIPQSVVLARYRSDSRLMWYLWPVGAALGVILAWALLPLPPWFGALTLLDLVPTFRAMIGIGIASALVTFLALATNLPDGQHERRVEWLVILVLICSAIVAAAIGGLVLRDQMPALGLRRSYVAVGSLVFGGLVALVLARRIRLASVALVLMGAALSLPVNPLYRGLEPLQVSPLQYAADLGYANTSPTKGTVLSYIGPPMDGLIVSSGHSVLNATNLYPNAAAWHLLDPDGRYEQVWNRYALAVYVYSEDSPPTISLLSGDAIQVAINPCDPALDRLQVSTVISATPMTDACLIEVGQPSFAPHSIAYVYRRRA